MSVHYTKPRNVYIGGDIERDFRTAQQRADKHLRPLGADVPAPVEGESLIDFRCRAFDAAKVYSPAMRNVTPPHEHSALTHLEDRVYADVDAYVRRPEGPLREVVEQDVTGRKISKFFGDPAVTWEPFSIPPKLVTGFNIK